MFIYLKPVGATIVSYRFKINVFIISGLCSLYHACSYRSFCIPMKLLLYNLILILTTTLLSGCQVESGDQYHLQGSLGVVGSTTFLILLTTGFFTGLSHCAGMCGSLVSAFSIQQKQMKGSVSGPLLLYQCGRISTYVLIGLIMSTIGSSLQLAALGQGWQVGLSIFVGLMMLAIGLNLMGVLKGMRWLESASLAKWVGERIRQLMISTHPVAPYGLGMANGMLPCGPVYAMALLAATSENPLHGGLIMLFFGLGTLPAMLSMGFVFAKLSVTLRRRLYRLAAGLIVLVGLQQIMRGMALAGLLDHFHIGSLMIW